MSDRLLVPYDGSEPSKQALEYALETFPDSDVTAQYVIPAPEGYWAVFEASEDRVPGGRSERAGTITARRRGGAGGRPRPRDPDRTHVRDRGSRNRPSRRDRGFRRDRHRQPRTGRGLACPPRKRRGEGRPPIRSSCPRRSVRFAAGLEDVDSRVFSRSDHLLERSELLTAIHSYGDVRVSDGSDRACRRTRAFDPRRDGRKRRRRRRPRASARPRADIDATVYVLAVVDTTDDPLRFDSGLVADLEDAKNELVEDVLEAVDRRQADVVGAVRRGRPRRRSSTTRLRSAPI